MSQISLVTGGDIPLKIWEDANYQGLSSTLGYGNYPTPQLIGLGNDTVTSLRVGTFTSVTLYENNLYTGRALNIMGPKYITNLKNYVGDFNDTTSSIKVVRVEPTLAFKAQCCRGEIAPSLCGEFAPGSVPCTNAMTSWCTGANLATPQCQTWCNQADGACDSAVISYCALNPSDQYCSCINSVAYTKGIINPKCLDRNCLETGYLTRNMRNTNCPSIINCEIQADLSNSGLVFSNSVSIQQNCGDTGTVTNPTTQPPPVQPTQVQTQPVTISTGLIPAIIGMASETMVMWFILFVIIAIVSGGLLYWILADDETIDGGGVSGGIGDGVSGHSAM